MRTTQRLLALLTVALVGVFVAADPVSAAPSASGSLNVADAVRAAVAGEAATVVRGSTSIDGSYVAAAGSTTASVGSKSPDLVNISAGQGQVHFGLRLPDIGGVQSVEVSDGTVIRHGASASTAVQLLGDGQVRALVTLASSKAPTAYRFGLALPAGFAVQQSGHGGGLAITTSNGSTVVGTIDAPWAKDATGRQLATSFSVEGNYVTQHVDTTGAAYPIVADPDVHTNCGVTSCRFYFTRTVTKNLQSTLGTANTAGAIFAGAVMCGKLPTPWSVVCAGAVAVYGFWIAYEINAAANRNGCFVVEISYAIILSGGLPIPGNVWFDDVPASSQWCWGS